MDLAQGKQFMGTSSHPGKIYDRTKEAAQFWKDNGKVQRVVGPDKAVDPRTGMQQLKQRPRAFN